jgi:3-oxoacyl-[acyl-carrier-protein] synthase-3
LPGLGATVADGLHFLRMDGKETFKNAVQAMCSAAKEVLRRCEIDITRIKCVIPHQANRRIIDAVGERLGATPEQLFINLHKYGNTSAASVAIALDEAVRVGAKSARRPDFARRLRRRADLGRGGHRMVS